MHAGASTFRSNAFQETTTPKKAKAKASQAAQSPASSRPGTDAGSLASPGRSLGPHLSAASEPEELERVITASCSSELVETAAPDSDQEGPPITIDEQI